MLVSFMPSPGTRVRMRDGRLAIVTKVTPDGEDDRVRFENGHEKHVTPWDLEEIIQPAPGPVTMRDKAGVLEELRDALHFCEIVIAHSAQHGEPAESRTRLVLRARRLRAAIHFVDAHAIDGAPEEP